jgi:hypothetical protein
MVVEGEGEEEEVEVEVAGGNCHIMVEDLGQLADMTTVQWFLGSTLIPMPWADTSEIPSRHMVKVAIPSQIRPNTIFSRDATDNRCRMGEALN